MEPPVKFWLVIIFRLAWISSDYFRLVINKLFSSSPNIPRGLSRR